MYDVELSVGRGCDICDVEGSAGLLGEVEVDLGVFDTGQRVHIFALHCR
jgi:hypothetical protein